MKRIFTLLTVLVVFLPHDSISEGFRLFSHGYILAWTAFTVVGCCEIVETLRTWGSERARWASLLLVLLVVTLGFFSNQGHWASVTGVAMAASICWAGCLILFGDAILVLKALCTCCAVQAPICLWQVAAQDGGILSGSLYRAGGSCGGPIQLGIVLALGAPIAAFEVLKRGGISPVAVFAGIVLSLVLSGTRAALLAALIGIAVAALLAWPSLDRKQKCCAAGMSSVIVILVALAFVMRYNGEVNFASVSRSDHSRWVQSSSGLAEFLKYPLGLGPGNVEYSITLPGRQWQNVQVTCRDSKNLLIQMLLTFGPIGGFVAALGFLWVVSWMKGQHRMIGVSGSLVAFCLLSIVESPLFVDSRLSSTLLIGMLFCMMAAAQDPLRREQEACLSSK